MSRMSAAATLPRAAFGLALLAILAAATVLAASVASAEDSAASDRIFGQDRYETAAELATATHDAASSAILASGEDFPDALAASYGPGGIDAPVLLTRSASLPQPTADALDDLDVGTVFLAGGEAAIDSGVQQQLDDLGHDTYFRVAGEDRYETAAAMLEGFDPPEIGTLDGQRTALLASGEDFADALAAGPLASAAQLPQLLTTPHLSDATEVAADAMEGTRYDVDIERVVIVGGPAAVSDEVEEYLANERGFTVERWYGANRAETAAAVADQAIDRLGFDAATSLLARGDGFADALAASDHAAEQGAPLMLAERPDHLGHGAADWFAERCETVETVRALGGTAAVSDRVLGTAVDAVDQCAGAPQAADELSASDLERDAAEQDQQVAFTLTRDLGDEDGPFNVELTHPRGDGLVDYDADAEVQVTAGSGEAELDFEPIGIGQLPGVVYTPGEDDGEGDRIEMTISAGATTADTDASSLATLHAGGPSATFDIGSGGPVAPAVGSVVSDDDAYDQHVSLHPVDDLPAGEELTVDLSAAEQGPVSYRDASPTVEAGSGEVTLDVDDGQSAQMTYAVGTEGDPEDAGPVEIAISPVATEAVDANERYDAPVSRPDTGQSQTTTFWIGQPPFE